MLSIVAVTFAGIAAANFILGLIRGTGTIEAGRAQIAEISATIAIAFALVVLAVQATFRAH